VNERLADQPDTTATATMRGGQLCACLPRSHRCHAATNANATPMVMCAVSVAEAIPDLRSARGAGPS
jgi:hypothetical protein